MDRLLKLSAILALLSVSAGAARVYFAVGHFDTGVTVLLQHTDANLSAVTHKAGATLDAINAPAGPGHKGGTIAQVNALILHADQFIGYSQFMAREQMNTLDGQVIPLLNHADASLSSLDKATADLRPLMTAATARVNAFEPIETNAALLFSHIDEEQAQTFASANALLTNPNLPVILSNVAGSTTSLNSMLFTFNAVETKATHNYLHPNPNPFVRTWQATEPFLLPVVQVGAAVVR